MIHSHIVLVHRVSISLAGEWKYLQFCKHFIRSRHVDDGHKDGIDGIEKGDDQKHFYSIDVRVIGIDDCFINCQ